MKTFTSSDLHRAVADVLNEVQCNGMAQITSRSRPNTVLILEERLNDLVEENRKLKERLS